MTYSLISAIVAVVVAFLSYITGTMFDSATIFFAPYALMSAGVLTDLILEVGHE